MNNSGDLGKLSKFRNIYVLYFKIKSDFFDKFYIKYGMLDKKRDPMEYLKELKTMNDTLSFH